MTPLTVEELTELARHGAGFALDAAELASEDIVEIMRHASARIVIRNAAELPMSVLLEISRIASGHVHFEWN